MRGKGFMLVPNEKAKRITPAYAGKSEREVRTAINHLRITPAYAGKSP